MLSQKTEVRDVKIKDLVLDKHIQMRASISVVAVQEYADAMQDGDTFPPIVVFQRFGGKFYVADGFHRVQAAKKLGRKTISAEVRDGGKREAMLLAMKANAGHGVRRTNADKQKAVEACLNDKEWVKWTDSEIARCCAVSGQLVARLRTVIGKKAERDVRMYVTSKGEVRTRSLPYRQPARQEEPEPKERFYCPHCGKLIVRH